MRAILFDFGGVLATEGFRAGLKAIARRFCLDPQQLYAEGTEAVYDSGYVLGTGSEEDFWDLLSRRTGLPPYQESFSREILRRFVLRPGMLSAVRSLRGKGFVTAILSDQTDWLDRLEARDGFFREFDRVFNSFHLGKGKRDPSIFTDVVVELGIEPQEALFIDDNSGHLERARSRGLQTILFNQQGRVLERLERMLGISLVNQEE